LKKTESSKKQNEKHSCEVRLLSLSSFTPEPRVMDPSSLADPLWVSEETKERFEVTSEDLLVQPKGGDYWAVQPGDTQLDGAQVGLVFSYQFIRVRPKEEILPEYLLWYLNHRETAGLLKLRAQGSTVPFLSKQALQGLRLPLPPLAVQEALVEVSSSHREEEALTRNLIMRRRAYLEDECLGKVLKSSGVKLEALNG
jgi:hypothetical protein